MNSFIMTQIKQRSRELVNWKASLKKAIEAKAKARLQFVSYVREMDHWCLQGHHSYHTTAAKIPI